MDAFLHALRGIISFEQQYKNAPISSSRTVCDIEDEGRRPKVACHVSILNLSLNVRREVGDQGN